MVCVCYNEGVHTRRRGITIAEDSLLQFLFCRVKEEIHGISNLKATKLLVYKVFHSRRPRLVRHS